MTSERDGAVATLDAAALTAGYASGALDPQQVTEAVLDRIARVDGVLHAFAVVEPDAARAAAAASAARWRAGTPIGALDGVPVTVKTNVAVAGLPLTGGSVLGADAAPQAAHGPATAALAAAGAVRLGTTTMPDFGMLATGVSSLSGVTRNPWNRDWNTGGSSSGAGAAAAAGLGVVHVGSDIGGSVRLPASHQALAALKPTFGLVPVDPPFMGRVVGPLARTVADVVQAMRVLTVPDARDHTHLDVVRLPWVEALTPLVTARGLRVGVHLDAGVGLPVSDAVGAIVERAARVFADAGAELVPLEPWLTPALWARLELFNRARTHRLLAAHPPERLAGLLPATVDRAARAAGATGADLLDAYEGVLEIRRRTAAATSGVDLVLSPVSPVETFPAEWQTPSPDPELAMGAISFTMAYSYSEQPAATVNAGFTSEGKPVGVQLIGRRFADVDVLRAAAWFEAARPDDAVPVWPDVVVD